MDKKNKGVGIIYDGSKEPDWAIKSFKKEFETKKVPVVLFDANTIDYTIPMDSLEKYSLPEIENLTDKGYHIWMNRVYPSESGPELIERGLSIVSWLSSRNYITINPMTACAADYDKNFAYQLMKQYDVPTPKTMLLSKENNLDSLLEEFGLPVIIKQNTGGKGINVNKIETKEQLNSILNEKNIVSGNYLIQEFSKSSRNHDIRIGVIDGNPIISYGRTLVNQNGSKDSWMASCHHGSKIIEYSPSEEELRLAVLSSKAIGATLNEVDMQITEKGPVIIENNPTPGYDPGEERWIELITKHIYNTHLENGN